MIAQVSIALLCLFPLSFAYPAPPEEQAFDKIQFSLDNGADVAFTQNGSIISVRQQDTDIIIFGDIGLITVNRENGTQSYNISFVNVAELDQNYVATGHNFSLVDALYTVDALFSASVDGVNVTAANLTTPLLDGSTLTLTVLVLSTDGEITTGSEPFGAAAGSIKLLAEISDWPFCESNDETCQNSTLPGSSLEITLDVIATNATVGRINENRLGFQLSETVNFTVAWGQEVLVDDELQPIVIGYPVISSVNQNVTQFTFGLPRFNSSAALDLAILESDSNFLFFTVATNKTKLEFWPYYLSLAENVQSPASAQIWLTNIRELNIVGQPIGVEGVGAIAQHARSGSFGSLWDITAPISTTFDNASCLAVNASGLLSSYATGSVANYLFTSPAEILVNNATYRVDEWTTLMMFGVQNWTFCETNRVGLGQCSGTDLGNYLEIELRISRYRAILKRGKKNVYSLGKHVSVTLPTKFWVDGFFLDMEPGYPQVNVRDGQSFVVLRFPKFATEVQYGALFRIKG